MYIQVHEESLIIFHLKNIFTGIHRVLETSLNLYIKVFVGVRNSLDNTLKEMGWTFVYKFVWHEQIGLTSIHFYVFHSNTVIDALAPLQYSFPTLVHD